MSEQSKIDAERAAFEADLIARWKNHHPVAFSVPEDSQSHLAGMMLARRDDGEYDNLVPREAWASWQARASLPVGVPDREWILHMLADKWPDDGEMVEVEFFRNWLDEVLDTPAAPTVKDEQVQCATPTGNACPGDGVGACKACPSLPAAGSAVEEVDVVAWRVSHPDTAWKVYERNPESWAAGDYEIQDLMTVAQCNRIVAALRAQIVERDAAIEEWSGTAVQNGMEVDRLSAELRAVVGVLDAVQGQFNRYGERFPDGFDSRVFRWVDDAVAGHALSAQQSAHQPELTVWEGPMPESNGKSNFTAVLMRKGADLFDGISGGMTIARSEYPDRVRYEADCVRWLIGELDKEPCIIDYDADKHSGYVAQRSAPERVSVPESQALVPLKFVQRFNTLAHNYSLRAVPPDYYEGMAGDAFRDAYARCGRDLAELRAILASHGRGEA